jgi:hypothetical protein
MFVHFGNSQRQFEAKLQSVRTGEVQPETLTVISKRASSSKKSAQAWVVFRNSRQSELVYPVPPELYNAVNPGSTVTGYYFPDGYLIPRYDSDREAVTAKWVFLSVGVLMGILMFLLSFVFMRRRKNAA